MWGMLTISRIDQSRLDKSLSAGKPSGNATWQSDLLERVRLMGVPSRVIQNVRRSWLGMSSWGDVAREQACAQHEAGSDPTGIPAVEHCCA